MRTFEPTLSERQEARAAARAAVLAKFKPKPAVTGEVIPWDEREAERIRALRNRPRRKRTYEHPTFTRRLSTDGECAKPAENIPILFARPEPIRFSACESVEFERIPVGYVSVRRKAAMKAWRRAQWREGNRSCAYCKVKLTKPPEGKKAKAAVHPPTMATVDHKEPLSLGGDDAAWNWCLACFKCNGAKGSMTEAQFRATMGYVDA